MQAVQLPGASRGFIDKLKIKKLLSCNFVWEKIKMKTLYQKLALPSYINPKKTLKILIIWKK